MREKRSDRSPGDGVGVSIVRRRQPRIIGVVRGRRIGREPAVDSTSVRRLGASVLTREDHFVSAVPLLVAVGVLPDFVDSVVVVAEVTDAVVRVVDEEQVAEASLEPHLGDVISADRGDPVAHRRTADGDRVVVSEDRSVERHVRARARLGRIDHEDEEHFRILRVGVAGVVAGVSRDHAGPDGRYLLVVLVPASIEVVVVAVFRRIVR